MAHIEQIEFCTSVKNRFRDYFKNCDVLDVGSMDINGNNRYLFKEYTYTGVDLGDGCNVDIVAPDGAHTVEFNGLKFDVVISTECFEHDRHYIATFKHMIRHCRGIVLFTCATTGRGEHGTDRVRPNSSPFTNDYYQNLTQADFIKEIDFDAHFSRYGFEVNNHMHDLYFWGIIKSDD